MVAEMMYFKYLAPLTLLVSCAGDPLAISTVRSDYVFSNGENYISFSYNFEQTSLNGTSSSSQNCSDAFSICISGPIAFRLPRRNCAIDAFEFFMNNGMDYASMDPHGGTKWVYDLASKKIILELDRSNNLTAIFYDMERNRNAIGDFIDEKSGDIDKINNFRFVANRPIDVGLCSQ